MNKTVLYIAASLDGFIAKPDGNLDWLTSIPNPQKIDYGYAELIDSIGTIIMGRKTYEEIIGFGVEWPYRGIDTYVVTRNNQLKILSPDTHVLTGNIRDFVKDLKLKTTKDIWLVGGGQLVTKFINEGILDKMIISLIPKIIGEGIPLFNKKPKETVWRLIDAKQFETGVVNLIYVKSD